MRSWIITPRRLKRSASPSDYEETVFGTTITGVSCARNVAIIGRRPRTSPSLSACSQNMSMHSIDMEYAKRHWTNQE